MINNQELSPDDAQAASALPSWRTEPEIDSERQQFLQQRLLIVPDIQHSIYPFKDIRLTRADVEWLLATHEQGCGPIDWRDPSQRERQGIDLRGANLQRVDLRGLPLARVCGGLTRKEWAAATLEQRAQAGIHLEGADLSEAHLEKALLRGAFFEKARLYRTHLEQATLYQAHFERAYLREAHLEGANMMVAHLEGADLYRAWLAGADLRQAICDITTHLEKATLIDRRWGCVLLADIHWSDCNLTTIDWRRVIPLGDEAHALSHEKGASHIVEQRPHIEVYQSAVRAYRQLANAMRAQGMNEEAVPFAYRAQVLQRKVLWQQIRRRQEAGSQTDPSPGKLSRVLQSLRQRLQSLSAYSFSWFLDLLAGYGYKPGRSLGLYLVMIAGFSACYLVLGHLSPEEALIFSVTAFHGRGFFPGPFKLSDPVTAVAALEAVVGLFIEVSFIATFTQRFFGR
jgi:hypothetical protein